MKVLAVIPSRYDSSRFPGKPLVDLKGKSMIRRVYEQVSKAQKIDELYVATDDERIFKEVESFDGQVVYTSASCRNGTERSIEALEKIGDFDLLLNVQGDEPFIHPEDLDQLLELFNNPEVDIASLRKPIEKEEDFRNPNRVKVVSNEFGEAKYFSRSPIPYSEKGIPDQAFMHVGVYAFRTNILAKLKDLKPKAIELSENLEQLRWLMSGFRIFLADTDYDPIGIDHPEDLEKARALIH